MAFLMPWSDELALLIQKISDHKHHGDARQVKLFKDVVGGQSKWPATGLISGDNAMGARTGQLHRWDLFPWDKGITCSMAEEFMTWTNAGFVVSNLSCIDGMVFLLECA